MAISKLNKKVLGKWFIYGLLYCVTTAIVVSVFILPENDADYLPTLRTVIIVCASILLVKYFIYMVLSPWSDVAAVVREMRYAHKDFNPRVSVIIPEWNESVGIVSTLQSLAESTHRNLEVVVVDDGSTDDSGKKVQDFIKAYRKDYGAFDTPIDFVYHYKENGGKGRALNRGIQISTGDIILSIDADCVLDPDAVANFVKCFRDPHVMAAVGNVKIGSTKSLIGTVQYLEFLFSFYFKKADSLVNAIYIIGGAAGAFRREVFQRIGLYNPRNITEDIEMSVRIQAAGMRIVYASDAIIYTEGASDLRGLIKQRQRWKRGRFQTFADHRYLFFSGRKEHNKVLTWLILPLAMFGEMQLFLEPLFLLFLYIYSWYVNDFSSFISGVVVVSSMFFVQVWFDDRKSHSTLFYFLAPIGWLLFYQTTFVEFMALAKAGYGFVRGKEMSWQRWQRKGLDNV